MVDRGYEIMQMKINEDKLRLERLLTENGFDKKQSPEGMSKVI